MSDIVEAITRDKEIYMEGEYIAGVNDVLLLLILAHHEQSFDIALQSFDFEGIEEINPIKNNLQKVREIWQIKN